MGTPREIAQLLEHWRTTGVPLNGGASLEQIAAAEQRCGTRIPEGLRSLYQAVNGMPERESDSHFFYLWPIEQLVAEAASWAVPANESILLFGDFLIASHAYGVRCAGPDVGSVHVFEGNQFEKVAESLGAFFAAVVSDPDRVRLLRSSAV
jgi:cell wall assembly regulator SMI1